MPIVKAPTDTASKMPETAKPIDSMSVNYASAEEGTELVPKLIEALPGRNSPVVIEGSFNPVEALKKLFPGRLYKAKMWNETLYIEVWSCRNCKRKNFKNSFDEAEEFPPHEENATIPGETLKYVDDDGKANVLQVFSTSFGGAVDCMFTGRSSCAVLALAWFKQEGDKWVLLSFEPAVGCYGQFNRMPEVKLLKYGRNNYGGYLVFNYGGPGGPFYSDLFAFGFVGGKFDVVLNARGVSLSNYFLSEWDVQIGAVSTSNRFGDIPMAIKGSYNMRTYHLGDYGDSTQTEAPIEVQREAKRTDSFDFRIDRVYTFRNGKYKLKQTSMTKSRYTPLK